MSAVSSNGSPTKGQFEVELPAGGRLALQDNDEVVMWNESAAKYIEDYGLVKANDLMLLGAILSQGVAMYRAQRELADPKKASQAVSTIAKASEQIRELEKALGIDKKTREQGGQHTIADYVTGMKRRAHEMGVRISDRVKAYEAFCMELRWKLRVLHGDEEDRAYHDLTPEKVLAWCENELAKIEGQDKEWAKQKRSIFQGQV